MWAVVSDVWLLQRTQEQVRAADSRGEQALLGPEEGLRIAEPQQVRDRHSLRQGPAQHHSVSDSEGQSKAGACPNRPGSFLCVLWPLMTKLGTSHP